MHRPLNAITMLIGALAALLFLSALSQPISPPPQSVVLRERPYVYVSKWNLPRQVDTQLVVTPNVPIVVSTEYTPTATVADLNLEPTYETGCGRDRATGEIYPESSSDERSAESPLTELSQSNIFMSPVVSIATCGATDFELESSDARTLESLSQERSLTKNFVESLLALPRQIAMVVNMTMGQCSELSSAGVAQLESLPSLALRPFLRTRI
jgi:hypothetical protein